jgi:hypothetical protein
MTREAPKPNVLLSPREMAGLVPFKPYVASSWSAGVGMLAARYLDAPASEIELPPSSHHKLVLVSRPSERGEVRYEDVLRHVPPAAGSVLLIPAGSPSLWRWSGRNDSLTVSLEPHLLARVAAESFDLDPMRVVVPPLDRLDIPQLQRAMQAIDGELMAGTAWGNLAAESLANLLAVQLIRHVLTPRRPAGDRDGRLPQGRLRSVVEFIEEHLDAGLTLGELAAVARLSPYHFAAVPGGHRAAAASVRHRPPRRPGQADPPRGRRILPGAGRCARGVLGPEPVHPPLQAPRRHHAGAVPDARKNRLTGRKPRQEY